MTIQEMQASNKAQVKALEEMIDLVYSGKHTQEQLQATYDRASESRSHLHRLREQSNKYIDNMLDANNKLVAAIKEKMDD